MAHLRQKVSLSGTLADLVSSGADFAPETAHIYTGVHMARCMHLSGVSGNDAGRLIGVFQMAKFLRIVAMVAAERIADAFDALDGIANGVIVKTDNGDPDDLPDAETVGNPIAARPRDVRRVATRAKAPQTRTRLAGKVIYTPVGTQRQINAMLAELTGVKTMKAFVLRDLAKHPGSSNAEVRARVAATAKKAGLSVESVDNVIWQLVNKGQINKQSEAAD